MAHIVTDVVLLGGLAFCARRLLGKRRIVIPKAEAVSTPARRTSIPAAHEQVANRSLNSPATTVVSTSAAPPASLAYLVGGTSTGARDRTAAMMDQMLGRGICTPIDG